MPTFDCGNKTIDRMMTTSPAGWDQLVSPPITGDDDVSDVAAFAEDLARALVGVATYIRGRNAGVPHAQAVEAYYLITQGDQP